jgi:hypothetical protein
MTSLRLFTTALVFMASLAAAGSTHAVLTRRGGEIDVRTAKGIGYVSLAALPGGGFVVVWSEPTSNWEQTETTGALLRRAPPPPSAAFVLRSHKVVVAAWFDADGQLIRGPVVVNQTPTGETHLGWYVQVAADADGVVLVVWRPWEAATVLGRFFDAEGHARDGEFLIRADPSPYSAGEVAVAATEPGKFVVIWNELDESLPYIRTFLTGRSVAVNGTLGDVFLVSPVEAPADQYLPSVVSIDDRRLLVAWFNEVGEQTIQARFVGDDPLTPTFDIAGGEDERRPRVCALKSGEFVFAWEGYQSAFEEPRIVDRGAWFRRYSATREPLGDPFPVLPADDQVQQVTGLVCPPEGPPMIVIDYNSVLIGRSMNGTALTTDFEIVRPYRGGADVISVGARDFVVTFSSCFDPYVDEEPDCDLRAQIFSREGHAPCLGDCDLSGHVTVNELVFVVRIALGLDDRDMRACLPADRNLDYHVDIAELVGAVATSLGGCQ